MHTAEVVFFGSIVALVYIYIGYPFFLFVLSLIKTKEIKKGLHVPFVSILIPAFNEKEHIGKTIENKLLLSYPKNRYEIIVISDESNDGTDEIARTYERDGVTLLRQEPRAGKTNALNLGVSLAKGRIIVFADANSIYSKDALKKITRNFKDPEVGYVTGKMIYENPDGTINGEGCSAFMRYENALRALETKVGSVVGVNGGIDAVRKSLYRPMRQDQLPDFVLPSRVVEQGYRVVYEPEAILRETSLANSSDEYKMRVRVSLRAFCALRDTADLLKFKKSILFSWQIWSHKVLRYLSLFFMAGSYAGNMLLVSKGDYYGYLFLIQTLGYSAAFISPLLSRSGIKIFNMLNYFVLINTAAMHAFFKFLMGRRQVLWTPRKG